MRLPFLQPKPLADAGPLYAAIVAEARRPSWYRDAGVPDTMDGRFAVLTSLLALADIRLERGADDARALGPRLAESFIADMDAQMREAGFGDPSLGKQARMEGDARGWLGREARPMSVTRGRLGAEVLVPWDEVALTSLYGESPALDSAKA